MKFNKRLWVNLGKTTVLSLGVWGMACGLLGVGYAVTDEEWHAVMQMTMGLFVLTYFYVLTNSGVGTLAKGAQMYDGVVRGLGYVTGAHYRRYNKLKKQRTQAAKNRLAMAHESAYIERMMSMRAANTSAALAATGVDILINRILSARSFSVLNEPDDCFSRVIADGMFIDLDANTVCVFDNTRRRSIKVAIPLHQGASVRDAILRRCIAQAERDNRYVHAAATVSESPDLTVMDVINCLPPVNMPINMAQAHDKTR